VKKKKKINIMASTSLQPIDPVEDSRVEHKTAVLNGNTYHYLYAVPKSGKWEGTVFLVGGK